MIPSILRFSFVPAISPGYNDRAVREGHKGFGRYFTSVPGSREGDIFREMIRQIALPMADAEADRIVMVTSFNEWYEDTQIEPTRGGGKSTRQDDSASGEAYSEGHRYADYGELYLEILREETGQATANP